MQKDADAFRTISEVAQNLGLPQHVLRFWETKFPQIKPLKRGGGRRYYRRDEVDLLRAVRCLLYEDGYTIRGVQRILKEQGARAVSALAHPTTRNRTRPNGTDLEIGHQDEPGAEHGSGTQMLSVGVASRDSGDPEQGGSPGRTAAEPFRRRLTELAREIEACSAILKASRVDPPPV